MKSLQGVALALASIVLLAGCGAARGPRNIDEVPYAGTPPESDWSRVAQIVPGGEIAVTLRGSEPLIRSFVAADASSVTVLNLTDPALPAAAVRALRGMALRRPESFADMRGNASFAEGDVRAGREGVFVGSRKTAELAQIVETMARRDVAEIRGAVVARGSVLGALLGGWVGWAIGVVPGLGGVSAGPAWALAISSTAVGGYLGSHWTSHDTEGLIYQAP